MAHRHLLPKRTTSQPDSNPAPAFNPHSVLAQLPLFQTANAPHPPAIPNNYSVLNNGPLLMRGKACSRLHLALLSWLLLYSVVQLSYSLHMMTRTWPCSVYSGG
jgi:hypothetical protein